jgi:hypothetical protein
MAVITGNVSTTRAGSGNLRRLFGYGAAVTMLPYLSIKVAWVVGALLGFLPRTPGWLSSRSSS